MPTSDACVQGTSLRGSWTFDDSAPGFVSRPGPCNPQQTTFRPSNYLAQPDPFDNSVEPDVTFTPEGGAPNTESTRVKLVRS